MADWPSENNFASYSLRIKIKFIFSTMALQMLQLNKAKKLAKVRVALRLKPLASNASRLFTVSGNTIDGDKTFDRIFGEESSNEDVFNAFAKDIVDDALHGINGCILAYGQTCSGKMHTMFGSESSFGIVQHALDYIFKNAIDIEVRMKYVEVYDKFLHDLLDAKKTVVLIQREPQSRLERVTNMAEFIRLKMSGDVPRSTEETNSNESGSSRSYAILRIDHTYIWRTLLLNIFSWVVLSY